MKFTAVLSIALLVAIAPFAIAQPLRLMPRLRRDFPLSAWEPTCPIGTPAISTTSISTECWAAAWWDSFASTLTSL